MLEVPAVKGTAAAHTGLMRERAGALPNALALAYAVCGYVGGFLLMAAPSWWANTAGVLLTAHAMVIAAYPIHQAAAGEPCKPS
jgi:hypothetical protein